MSTRNASNCSNSALNGSGEEPTRTTVGLIQPIWERLPDALQRIMDANGTSKDEAKAAICQALGDRSIGIRGYLDRHATRRMTSKEVLDGDAFQIPPGLEPRHLDWEESRPTKTWVVKRGAYGLPGHWHLAWIELSRPDVTKVLCPPPTDRGLEAKSAQSSMTATSQGPKRAGPKRRGPPARKLHNTTKGMRNDLRQGTLTLVDLEGVPEKILSARYGVSRDTARKARNVVLSEFVEAKTPTIDN
jgi:hypothetical protein